MRRILGCLRAEQERDLWPVTEVCSGQRPGRGGTRDIVTIPDLT